MVAVLNWEPGHQQFLAILAMKPQILGHAVLTHETWNRRHMRSCVQDGGFISPVPGLALRSETNSPTASTSSCKAKHDPGHVGPRISLHFMNWGLARGFLAATMDSQPPSSRGAVETMPKRLKPPAVSPGNGSFVVSEWLNPCLVKAFQNGQMAKVQNPKQRVQPALLLPQEMKRGCWCPANEIRCIIGARLGSQVCRLMVFNKSNRGEGRKGLMGTREPLVAHQPWIW